jgi:DNA adenine methylase
MPLNAFPYIGGKARLSESIIGLFDGHDCFVEAFGGSAAILLNKPVSTVEVYNEANANLSTFFEVARDRPEELVDWLEGTPYSKELNAEYEAELRGDVDLPDLERAGKFFFVTYSNYAGKVPSGFKRPSSNYDGDSGGDWRYAAKSYDQAISKVRDISERFRGVVVECGDWQDVVDEYDSRGTLFYFDPPYNTGHEKGAEYEHDFDADELEPVLSDITGKFALSYGRVPDWAADYHTHGVDFDHRIKNTNGAVDAKEYMITNYDPDDTDELTDANQAGVDDF